MAAIFGRFSQNCEALLVEAQTLAGQIGRPVRTDVLLLAILNLEGSLGSTILKSIGIDKRALLDFVTSDASNSGKQNHEMQSLLEESIKLAGRFHFSIVEIEHFLLVIAKDERCSGYKALKACGAEPQHIVNRLTEWLFSVAMLHQTPQPSEGTDQRSESKVELERFVTNLTLAASKGTLDPVIGREKELEEMLHILLRRRKNNPLLVGEPGVGKTALIDALAQKIVAKKVPRALIGKQVLSLDLGLVVAGTMYRGQFEERLKGIIQEISHIGSCIVFIDEVHTLTGTGSAEGGFDAANILKPALARGEITIVGATTHDEYRKHILKDKALDRRFQTVMIEEPNQAEAIAMVKGIRKELERHHRVKISQDAIRSAVELSARYIHDRYLPDKAIDLLDQAATLFAEHYIENPLLIALQNEVAVVGIQKSEAALQGDYDLAKELMEKENDLVSQLLILEKEDRAVSVPATVTMEHIALVIQERIGIPTEEIIQTLRPLDIHKVKTVLEKRILGQADALTRISQLLMRSQLGLQQSGKPIGSFLLVGPTGVGKTETARALAQEVFGDAKALIKVDMSEFMERHTVSNLIGAPAGYVGFEQGGSLTEQVRRRPYAVVLLDEVEKAHPDVFNILLQVLEDGYLTDNSGRTISFEHCLIIMTSNIGMESFNQAARIGFDTNETAEDAKLQKEQEELHTHIRSELEDFRPELLGRLSGILYYKPLAKAVVKKLIQKKIKEVSGILKKQGTVLSVTPKALTWIIDQYDPDAGARSIDRLFLERIEPVVITTLIEQERPAQITLDLVNEKLVTT